MKLYFSIVIPVYNRPQEIDELLNSLTFQTYKDDYEIVIVEDNSENKCEEVIQKYKDKLTISYFVNIENIGAGKSRNYGMQQAKGNYFIILDSDVLLPTHYLETVKLALTKNYTDAFGGADAAHKSFTALQKAINYSMTSVLTTGGIRGKKNSLGKFQPRSFNMGLSKIAFEKTNGYSEMKYGEDIDLTFRLWNAGFETQFIEEAFVYHKRRTNIEEFYKQTNNFGGARPKLNRRYPETSKPTFWFPTLFIFGFDFSILLLFFGWWIFVIPFVLYFTAIFIDSLLQNKNIKVAFLSIITTYIQFAGYGLGFLKSYFKK
ncbi:glycosyltransferase [Urechidicola croceus]|uniref:Glycosyl transferase family 2 n=1 Tax=Urechidicola croceus TaxID=1850246 RepID=A0A1D8P3M4_9FLAO|nr:glycosyltransferase [Urechidicola croceus]AOW19195.1 glycosyl transferase family 2 [Urechidicola croceus]